MKITQEQSNAVLGLVTLMLYRRQELHATENSAAAFMKGLGAEDTERMEVRDWIGEAVHNYGDDPLVVTEQLLQSLELEVVNA